jgi:hypothetical protein
MEKYAADTPRARVANRMGKKRTRTDRHARTEHTSQRIDRVALFSLILAGLGVLAAFVVIPEVRKWFGLEDANDQEAKYSIR